MKPGAIRDPDGGSNIGWTPGGLRAMGISPNKTGISGARNGFRSIKGQDIWQTAGERKIGANKHEMGMQL